MFIFKECIFQSEEATMSAFLLSEGESLVVMQLDKKNT